jgi:hypothetical protein
MLGKNLEVKLSSSKSGFRFSMLEKIFQRKAVRANSSRLGFES